MKSLALLFIFFCFLNLIEAQVPTPYVHAKIKRNTFDQSVEKEVVQLTMKGQYKAAIQIVKVHQESLKDQADELYYAYSLFGLGKLYTLIHDYTEAEKALLEAKAIRARLLGKEHPDYYASCFVLAELYFEMGDYDQVEALLDICDELEVGELPIADILMPDLQAKLYEKTARLKLAEPLLLKNQKSRAKLYGKNHPAYVDALMSLADFYILSNRISEAEQILLEAINTSKVLDNQENDLEDFFMFNHSFLKDDLLDALHKLADIHLEREEFQEAQKLLVEAQKTILQHFGKNHLLYAQTSATLAEIDLYIGEIPEAIELLKDACQKIKEIKGSGQLDYLNILEKLAQAHLIAKDVANAEEQYRLYLETFRKHHKKHLHHFAEALNHSAHFYFQIGNPKKAKELYLEAMAVNAGQKQLNFQQLKEQTLKFDYFNVFDAIASLEGLLEVYQQELDKSFELCQLILSLNTRACHRFTEKGNKLRLMDLNAKYTAKLMQITEQLLAASSFNNQKQITTAYRFIEENKSILLEQSLHAHKARSMSDLPDSLIQKQLKLEKDKALIEKELLVNANDDLEDILRQELNSINIQLADFQHKIEKEYPKYYALKYKHQPTEIRLIQETLAPRMLLLEYFQTKEKLYLFVISKDKVELYPITLTPKELHKHAEGYRKALSDYHFIKNEAKAAKKLYVEEAYWLYEHCFSNALKDYPKKQHIVIIPDGELAHIPFEAFLTNQTKASDHYKQLPYLLRKVTISYSYSATLWQENSKGKHSRRGGRILAMAASYPKDAENLQLRAPNVKQLREHLQELPAAKEEVKQLSQLFEGAFLSENETNEALFKDTATHFGVIHLAMHALLNKEHPILSSLAFSENGDSLEDNFLQAHEIAHLTLDAKLVVLSACETGYGKFQQGEGVMSLGRSFMYAGVPSLVVSMWEVNDISTSIIMKNFYQNLNKGMNKSQALQYAKLDYIENSSEFAAHPAFWAAFVQLGDYHSIYILSKSGLKSIYLFILLAVLVVLAPTIYLFWKRSQKAKKQ